MSEDPSASHSGSSRRAAAAEKMKEKKEQIKKHMPALHLKKPHAHNKEESSPLLNVFGAPRHQKVVESLSGATSILIRTFNWEVVAPPPITSVKGALVPRAFTGHRRRKISIEIHRIESASSSSSPKNKGGPRKHFEECIVRILWPATKEERKASKSRRFEKLRARHHRNNLPPVAEEKHGDHDDDDDDDESDDDESTIRQPGMVDESYQNFAMPAFGGWEEKYRFPIRHIVMKGTSRTGVFVQVTLGRNKQTRQLIFDTIEEAEEFRSVLTEQLALEQERNDKKLEVIFGGQPPPEKDDITYLLEVVSGWDLPIGDLVTSDPYVVCSFNGRDVHRTETIPRTLDPIWTVRTGSFFLFKANLESLFLSEGLFFTVKDYDTVGADEALGVFTLSPSKIYAAKGERLEFKLQPPLGQTKTKEVPGHVAIRCRRATDHDISFMKEQVYKSLKSGGVNEMDLATDQAGGFGAIQSYFQRQTRLTTDKDGHEVREYNIRPHPDPKRQEETAWMTKAAIDEEVLHDSYHWIDVGSGDLGRVHVEILGCNNLPNTDSGGRNKTDAFVAMIFEDAMMKTDVVDNCLNPRWLPWLKRAAVFHIHHSSSALHLGVFDYERSISPTDEHDLLGRVTVDIANLRPDTVYMLTYDIYTTSRLSDRKSRGQVTLRLRIEIEDERNMILSNLEPPPEFYVNTKTRKDFRVVNYACTGKFDVNKYDIKIINSYIEELLATQHAMYYMNDAFLNLFLWRGTFPLNLFGMEIMLPVHSFSAFVTLAWVVERPQLAPAWFFGALGWLMLATMDYRLHSPDPWLKCKDFGEFVTTLAVGFSPYAPYPIEPNENAEEAKQYIENMEKRIQDAENAAKEEYEENLKAQEELEREMEDVGDANTDISTNRAGGFSVDPFKAVLFPVQQNLGMVCRYLRHARYILSWEECYISFWFTAGCFMISIIFLFVPWFFIIKWTSRIVVWTLFGPWMKLVDVFYVSKIKELTEEELEAKKQEAREKRQKATAEAVAEARIKKENAMKLKAMKMYMFGKYISKIPVLKQDRFKDIPLSESYAVPYKPTPLPLSEIAMQEAGYNKTRLPGQHLVGEMIPEMESVGFTDAPIGQPIKQRALVDREKPAGEIGGGPESTTQAYIKLGSLVVVSTLISWFAVPFFSAVIDKLLASLSSAEAEAM